MIKFNVSFLNQNYFKSIKFELLLKMFLTPKILLLILWYNIHQTCQKYSKILLTFKSIFQPKASRSKTGPKWVTATTSASQVGLGPNC